MSANPIVWQANEERVRRSAMYGFMQGRGFDHYADLHQWSVAEPLSFWPAVRDTCEIHFDREADVVLSRPDNIMNAGWFVGAKLNFAAHLLRHSGDSDALVFCGEDGSRRTLSRDELRCQVADVAAALRASGVVAGDRVAGFLPNCPEAIVAMLATTSIGAVWSSCSPDFGSNGVIDRFGQIEPKVMFVPNAYFYNGKVCDVRETVAAVSRAIASIKTIVVVPFVSDAPLESGIKIAVLWSDYAISGEALTFVTVDFDHPLYIMFSSGTTGVPKCIVHGHGGTLLQQSKEHVLHTDVGVDDTLFYFTTCGWMMWNWLVCGLGSGATLILFDGSPFFDDGRILWEIAEQERITIFGTSAKYIAALQKAGRRPADEYSLPALRTVLSTGSPLAPASFDYVYDAIGRDIMLSSISGGTDIVSCFALGNPILPVRRGELQCIGLGMAVAIFDDEGRAVVGERGELVCTKPIPCAPLGFWNDPDSTRYHAAYFERFEGVWAQGDFAELTEQGGLIIHGRSDAVLNPGGVRIGTAEIYRQVEKLDEIVESIAVGQDWQDDVRVVLFVVLRDGLRLDADLEDRIRRTVRDNATPRHVPARIVAVPDIPRTKSGKIVELAVRAAVHGEAVKNTEALANPQALEFFRNVAELQA
jgi:acetoacetyl-CoA synthetase